MQNISRSQKIIRKLKVYKTIVLAALLSMPAVSAASSTMVQDLIDNLSAMRTIYGAQYAPVDWKKNFAGYDLETEYQKAVQAAQSKAQLNQVDARRILKDFIYATRDYHVSISFYSTAEATLPFTVREAEGRFFLVYIDRAKLPENVFPFQVGDELIEFADRPVTAVVTELQNEFIENVALTDRSLATHILTRRRASRGFDVPSGPVNLKIKKKSSEEARVHQLIWDYKPEFVLPRKSDFKWVEEKKSRSLSPMMDVNLYDKDANTNPYAIGARKTFTPDLGKKIWESGEDSIFHAYTYMTDDRKIIGYLRLPAYGTADYVKAVDEFASHIERFEKTTDAMVIDQVNNPGGSVFYLYALASHFAKDTLTTPLHRMTITQSDVLEAVQTIEKYKDIKNDEEANKALTRKDLSGYPVSYQFVKFMLSFAQFTIDEWNAGRTLSHPYWIAGVNSINPAAKTYSKPVLLLINELDFSGGDFFPTILQDNKRVTVMGTRTAGAGGYVYSVTMPNNLGIESFRLTGSIAERVNGNPIENLGVTPDIEYSLTAEDYTTNFTPYVRAINKAVVDLIK